MPAESNALPVFDASVLDQLACPECLGELRLEETRLLCAACGRVYPIVDGIPILIAGRENTEI
ncbi:MAG: Trm112 family protein [Terracidiphilus sp.]